LQGRHTEAQAAYRRALAAAPGMSEAAVNLGLSLALSGDGTQAVGMLRPLATAPEASPLQRADLALAVAGTRTADTIPAPPASEATTLAINVAPSVAVHRQDLPPPVAVATVTRKGRAAPLRPVDLALVTADASAVERPDRPILAITPPASSAPLPAKVPSQPSASLPTAAPASPRRHAATSAAGYYVQMAALDSAEAASAQWQKMRARLPSLLADRTPAVQLAEVKDRTFWRLRTGLFASARRANAFCAKLKIVGSGCWTIAATRD
jgi:cell division septation protein DedD